MYNGADKRTDETSGIAITGIEDVKLTARQQMFCEYYLKTGCRNASEAIRHVGYEGKQPAVAASVMLRRVNVKKYLRQRKTQMLKEAGIQSYNILIEIARIAFSDIRQLYNEDNTLKDITQLSDEAAAALEGVETDEITDTRGNVIGITKKVKMSSKLRALELLMKFKGLLDKDDSGNSINFNNFNVSLDLGGTNPALQITSKD